MMDNRYVTKDGKKLRIGYTTGSCAAAAAKASAIMLFSHKILNSVCLITPSGIELTLEIHDIKIEPDKVKCAVKKDSGDDPDVTNGMLIYAEVTLIAENSIIIDGGQGIGRVTKSGLDQPVGNAAINSIPRKMITQELKSVKDDYLYDGGFNVVISAPNGEEIAVRTFNSRLGIIGGISILGTSGIVEPMSESAIIDTIRTELNLRKTNGEEYLLLTPGNYGENYIKDVMKFNPEQALKCSNYVGNSIEYAADIGYKGILLIGHIGKLIKLAGGLFNTHSRYGDCRAEIMITHSAMSGIDSEHARRIMDSATVDEMINVIDELNIREQVLNSILNRIEFLISERIKIINSDIEIGVMMFSLKMGLLGMTDNVIKLSKKIKGET